MSPDIHSRAAVMDAIAERIKKLRDSENLMPEMLEFERGMIFGMIATAKLLGQLTPEEVARYIARTDSASLPRVTGRKLWLAKVMRN